MTLQTRLDRIERECPTQERKRFTIEAETEGEASEKLLTLLLGTAFDPGERYVVTRRLAGMEETCTFIHVPHEDRLATLE